MKFNSLTLALAAVFSAASTFGAIRAVSPTAWNGDPNCWQMKRHNEKMSVVTNGGAQVVFIGDSITHGWEGAGQEQLKRYFGAGELKMLNLGTSGDRTEHVLWRLTAGRELDGYEAKAIFLMIGTNNAHREPAIDTILGIREIVRTIRLKQPKAKLMLSPIFPRDANANDGCRRRNEVVNREIRNFADGTNVFWLDFNDQFLTVDGRLPAEIFPDRLHPAAFGYEIWAAAALPYARAAVAGAPMPPNRFAPFVREENVRTDGNAALYPASHCEYDWWLDRMLERRNAIAESNGAFDIVLFGDSITEHLDERPGGDTLAELRKTYTVLNIGYSGDRTENLLWRGEYGELDGYRAKCIVLLVGTNNTWHRRDRPETIAAGIRKILDLIARKQPGAKTLLLPIFPCCADAADPKRVNNDTVNAIIRGYADGERVIWVDFASKFLDGKGDTLRWMPDRLHPNAEAYREIWTPALLPHFKKIVGK